MKKPYLIILLLTPVILFSQNIDWIKTTGDILTDFGQSVVTDSQGNIYVTGLARGTVNFSHDTLISVNYFWFFAKYDSTGNNLWAVQYNMQNAADFTGKDFQLNSQGDAYLVGNALINGFDVGVVVKVDGNGTSISQGYLPGNVQTLDFDSHNNYIIAGYYPGGPKSFFAYFNAADSNLWHVDFTSGSGYSPACVRYAMDNSFYLSGTFSDTLTLTDVFSSNSIPLHTSNILSVNTFIAKYDSTGHLLSAKTYNDSIPAIQMVIAKPSDALYLLEENNNLVDYLVSFDAQGNEAWTNQIPNAGNAFAWCPRLQIHDSNIYFIGGCEQVTYPSGTGGTGGTFYLDRYDFNGNLTGSMKTPRGTGVTLIAGGLAFIGNSMVLTGGEIGSGTWGNQTVTGDGTVGYSNIFLAKMDESNLNPVSDINEIKAIDETTVFPNPNNGQFTIRFNLEEDGEMEISLINALGQIVHSEIFRNAGKDSQVFDFSNLSTGIYFLKIRKGENWINRKVQIYKD